MRIDERIAADAQPSFSFEFFPPKTEDGARNLEEALSALSTMDPTFVSVTYGAGGSPAEKLKTIDIVSRMKADFGLEAMAHFTCVGATVDELRATLDLMSERGVENVLALRGDPPPGQDEWTATEGGLRYSRELIEMIRDDYDFAIGAASFPETHIHATDAESDLRYTKEKVDAGAQFLITQLFFDNRFYYDHVARAREIGIEVPIIPGIMPITERGPDPADHRHVRLLHPGPSPAGARAACRRPGRGDRLRRRLRDPAVRRPARQRRPRDPLLHAQPLTGHARDPQRAAHAEPVGRSAGLLDVQRVSDARPPVDLPRDVDRVVLAVGADAPRAEEPAPEAELALLGQRLVELEDAAVHFIVRALLLAHPVDEHRVGLAHSPGEPDSPLLHRVG